MDIIFLAGNVLTLDSLNRRAEAVAVRSEKIVAVGTNAEVKKLAGPKTKVVNLAGRTLIPGFIDPHNHFSMTVFDPVSVDCWSPPHESLKSILEAVATASNSAAPGQWVWGNGMDLSMLREERGPTRWELDEAAPENPVCLFDTSYHTCYANSLALNLAKIDRHAPDPHKGWILKDDRGEPTGTLWERAMDLVHGISFRSLLEHHGEGVAELVCRNCVKHLACGVTSVGDAVVQPAASKMYETTDKHKKLPIVVHQMLGGKEFFAAPNDVAHGERGEGNVSDRLRGGAMKIFMDPVRPQSALVKCQPDGTRENVGEIYYNQEEVDALVLAAHKNGLQVCIHCCGTRSVEQALNSFERAQREHPNSDPRFRIEHFTLPTKEQIKRARALGVVASVQPPFIYTWAFEEANTAREMGGGVMVEPYRTMLDEGLTVAAGSDCPCAPLEPLVGLKAMVTRKARKDGSVVAPEEAVTPLEGLRMYTINSAAAMKRENEVGSIEVGKRADLVVLSHDPTVSNPDFIPEIRVEQTYVDGKLVYQRY